MLELADGTLGVVVAQASGSSEPSLGRIVALAILLAILVVSLVIAALLRGGTAAPRQPARDAALPPPPPDDSRATLAHVADALPVHFVRYATDGRVIGHCEAAARLFGTALDEARRDGQALLGAIHPDDRSTWLAGYRSRTLEQRGPIELQYRVLASGSSLGRNAHRWIHEHIRPITTSSGAVEWDALGVDVTERRDADERHRQTLELARTTVTVLRLLTRADASVATALAGLGAGMHLSRVTVVTIDAARSTATASDEWTAPGAPSALDRRRDQPPEKTGWWLSAAREGRTSAFRRDGSNATIPPIAVSMHPEVQSIVVVPVIVRGELRAALVAEDLTAPRRFRRDEVAVLEAAADGVARLFDEVGVSADAARLLAAQRELERAELVSLCAAAIGHDLNNVLFAIGGQVAIMRQQGSGADHAASIESVERSLHTASSLAPALAAALAQPSSSPAPIARLGVRDAISRGVRIARQTFSGLAIEADLAGLVQRDGEPTIEAGPDALAHVVQSLAMNVSDRTRRIARERASASHGIARVAARIDAPGTPEARLVLAVEDDGERMSDDARRRALSPRASLKGLADASVPLLVCQRVVRELGGEIALDDAPTLRGLRATVTIPLARPSASGEPTTTAPRADADAPSALAELGMVLVVEDDPAVRRILTRAFAANDVEVLERSDAAEVESLLGEGAVNVDLVVMDVDLPGISGMECARRLRARGCRVPILFVTGGTTELDPDLEPARLLRKPFPLEELVAAACSLLKANGAKPRSA